MEPFHLLADSPIYIELSASPAYSFENHWHQAAITSNVEWSGPSAAKRSSAPALSLGGENHSSCPRGRLSSHMPDSVGLRARI